MSKKSIASFLFAVCGLIIIGFVSFKAFRESQRNKQIEKEIDAIRTQAEKIKKNNQELEERIGYFQTPEFQEKVAKDKLNFQKNDEEVVIIKSSPSARVEKETGDRDLTSNLAAEDKRSNYQKWWEYFFKY